MRDLAIMMAEAIAGRTKSTLGGVHYPVNYDTLQLKNLFHEIILLAYQQRVQLKIMLAKRDIYTPDSDYWATSSFSFNHQEHPLRDRSYWTAARRALVAFD